MVVDIRTLKPALRPEFAKGQIIKHRDKLYESLQRSNGTYHWHLLSPTDVIDESGVSVFSADANIERYLNIILTEMRNDRFYRYSDIDYDTFHENRARFPSHWNQFLQLYRGRKI